MTCPLNGKKTYPLSQFAKGLLSQLARGPMPCQDINPGLVDRLTRGDLAEIVSLPSPFDAHKGGNCDHLQITEAGRLVLETKP